MEALLKLLENERELSKRADWMHTLAYIRPERIAGSSAGLYQKHDKLDTYAKASLCLALAKLGTATLPPGVPSPTPSELLQMAAAVARELESKAVVRSTTAHWSAEEGGYSWRNDDTEVTARVLRALLAALPQSSQVQPDVRGITVRRFFQVTAEDPSKADTVASGTEIEVQVEIDADADYRYVILEDPIPAGCEVSPNQDETGRFSLYDAEGRGSYARQEVRDDRVVFFLNDLHRGRTRMSYRLHAETPGSIACCPAWHL